MQITPDLIKYLESLARITLSEDEEKKVGSELQDILTYIDMLNELDTDGVEAMSHTFPYNNVFREDVVVNGDDRENMLKNAPEQKDGCYKVPKTFD